MATQDKLTPSSEVQKWLDVIKSYETEFKKWETRVRKILKRYRDEQSLQNRENPPSHFNILWANVSTLVPATFARLPKPDVSRRFSDRDPVGRVAALILERALDFEIQHYEDYRATMRACVYDRFLGGRGTAWARYEPHVRAAAVQSPVDGEQTTDDVDSVQEELDYECAPVDYVHWNDFGHTVARTWEEVPAVWRRVYLTKEALIERFGEEKAKDIPLDATPEELKRSDRENPELMNDKKACIYEIWDKTKKEAIWLSKSVKADVLDRQDSEALAEKGLEFEGFFPCPKPLYATMTNDSLIPVPDFSLYQDQAQLLDLLEDRIDGLIKALQVKGVYDASLGPEIARLFTDSDNTDLRAVKNWQNFAEKNGLKGSIDLVDLTPIANALQAAYEAMEQQKQQVYDITGIADIIRGQTKATETATAQQIKGQYAGLRLKDIQNSVAQFAADLLRLKAQIVAGFDPQTLMQIASVDQLNEADQQYIEPALQLIRDKPLRNFRVEISADSLVQIDEQAEKEATIEMLGGIGSFLEQAAKAPPVLAPMLGELLKFAVARFKVGRPIEGMIDQALEQLKQMGPPPDPEQMKEQAKAEVEQEMTAKKVSQDLEHAKRSADLDIREMKFKAEKDVAMMDLDAKSQKMKMEADMASKQKEHEEREMMMTAKETETQSKAAQTEAQLAEKQAGLEREYLEKSQSSAELKEQTLQKVVQDTESLKEAITNLTKGLEQVAKLAAAKKRIVRDQSGRAVGLEVVNA